jgi:DNA-binding transcriptional LysR family regulator
MSFGLLTLPDILDEFLTAYPQVSLDVCLSDTKEDLVAGGFDLALRIGELSASSLIARRLCDIPFAMCASPDFVACHGPFESPRDLSGLPGVIYANADSPGLSRWQGPDGTSGTVMLSQAFRANNGDFMRELAVRGVGALCEPRFILDPALKAGQLVEILPDHDWGQVGLYAVYPPTNHMTARLRALIDFLSERLRTAAM